MLCPASFTQSTSVKVMRTLLLGRHNGEVNLDNFCRTFKLESKDFFYFFFTPSITHIIQCFYKESKDERVLMGPWKPNCLSCFFFFLLRAGSWHSGAPKHEKYSRGPALQRMVSEISIEQDTLCSDYRGYTLPLSAPQFCFCQPKTLTETLNTK